MGARYGMDGEPEAKSGPRLPLSNTYLGHDDLVWDVDGDVV